MVWWEAQEPWVQVLPSSCVSELRNSLLLPEPLGLSESGPYATCSARWQRELTVWKGPRRAWDRAGDYRATTVGINTRNGLEQGLHALFSFRLPAPWLALPFGWYPRPSSTGRLTKTAMPNLWEPRLPDSTGSSDAPGNYFPCFLAQGRMEPGYLRVPRCPSPSSLILPGKSHHSLKRLSFGSWRFHHWGPTLTPPLSCRVLEGRLTDGPSPQTPSVWEVSVKDSLPNPVAAKPSRKQRPSPNTARATEGTYSET